MAHEFYTPADFNEDERDRRNSLYVYVVEGGLAVCKRCGAAEAEIDDFPDCASYRKHVQALREERADAARRRYRDALKGG